MLTEWREFTATSRSKSPGAALDEATCEALDLAERWAGYPHEAYIVQATIRGDGPGGEYLCDAIARARRLNGSVQIDQGLGRA